MEQHKIIHTLISKVVVFEDKIQIHFEATGLAGLLKEAEKSSGSYFCSEDASSQKSKMVCIEFGKLGFAFEGDLRARAPPLNL